MTDSLLHKIEKFTDEERKLLLYKLKNHLQDMGGDTQGGTRLVAYIKSDESLDLANLRSNLRKKLPEYMVPNAFRVVDQFPQLPNGKIDKKALANTNVQRSDQGGVKEAETEVEKQLVTLWEEVLDHSPIYTNDDFFELGGDSMLSIKLFWLIEKRLKVKLPPTTLLNTPTIAGIAGRIADLKTEVRKEEWEYLFPFKETGDKPALFCIHGGEGHVLFYKSLPEFVDEGRPVYFVQPKGLNGYDPMHKNIVEMSESYISEIRRVQPNGPYNLLFYCCSALVMEMGKQLREKGLESKLIVVDSAPKHVQKKARISKKDKLLQYFRRFSKYPLKTLGSSIKFRYQKHIEPTYIKLSNDKVAQRLQRIRLQLRKVQQNYNWEQSNTKITLIQAEIEHPEIMKRGVASWKHWCLDGVNVIITPGNHYTIFQKPYVKALGENVEDACG
ncbi:MAG: thioesterase domain-containing protein [Flavobacteriaceae bacterium]